MKAIILAAGQGTRLRNVTNGPKCLLEICGETILDRQLRLLKNHNVEIVIGYKAQEIVNRLDWNCRVKYNPFWNHSNTLVSLIFAAENTDTLVINGDVVFADDTIEKLLLCDYSAAAVQLLDLPTSEEVVAITNGEKISNIGKQYYSNVEAFGVYLLRAPLMKALRRAVSDLKDPWNAYYENALDLVLSHHPVETIFSEGIEIDTPEDYERAEQWLIMHPTQM